MAVNALSLLLLLTQGLSPILENDFVAVHRNYTLCAAAESRCGDRVIIALGAINLEGTEMQRGDVRVFSSNDTYEPPEGGEFVEVVLKSDRPAVRTAAETIVPENYNVLKHEGERFRIIEGRLRPGDTRERHTHDQRVIIYLNSTRLRQWPDGEPERFTDLTADSIVFSEPTTHAMENIGNAPVRNIVIELKP